MLRRRPLSPTRSDFALRAAQRSARQVPKAELLPIAVRIAFEIAARHGPRRRRRPSRYQAQSIGLK